MTQIIGFAGKKQSGKNTACNFVFEVYCFTLSNAVSFIDLKNSLLQLKKYKKISIIYRFYNQNTLLYEELLLIYLYL